MRPPKPLPLLMAALGGLALVVAALAAPAAWPTTQALSEPPEVASYLLNVTLDPTAKTVSGTGTISYRNPSPDTLNEVWLRLYLKAFSSPDTVWMRESGGGHRGYSAEESHGDIIVTRLAVSGGPDLLATSTITDTLLRAPLPVPLGPGEQLQLDVAWESELPHVFARTGYGGRDDTFFMVGQWYPKMAVYHEGRWDTEPWHTNSEFFHDFGRYEVIVTAPAEYVVAGAGVPQGESETVDGARTNRFVAEGVTDFAFAASPDFELRTAQAGPVEVALYDLPAEGGSSERYLDTAVDSLAAFGEWYGPYPHPRLSIIDVPESAGGAGGMEYPTLITGGTLGAPEGSGFLDLVVAHEIGHQWWPMQTATNEGREPWLDEGLTEYSGMRLLMETDRELFLGISQSAAAYDLAAYATSPDVRADLPAWEYGGEYGVAVYNKPAVGLLTLERVVGTERFRAAMATYLEQWRYRHPTAADFRAVMEAELGDLSWFFDDFIGGTGVIGYRVLPIERGPDGSSVTLECTGEVRAPVELRVRLASGREETFQHACAEPSVTQRFPAGDPVVEAVADPEHKLYAEIDRRDNGAYAEARVAPAAVLAARLAFWTQVVIQTIGLLG